MTLVIVNLNHVSHMLQSLRPPILSYRGLRDRCHIRVSQRFSYRGNSQSNSLVSRDLARQKWLRAGLLAGLSQTE